MGNEYDGESWRSDLSSGAKRHSDNCSLTSVDGNVNEVLIDINKEMGSIIKRCVINKKMGVNIK